MIDDVRATCKQGKSPILSESDEVKCESKGTVRLKKGQTTSPPTINFPIALLSTASAGYRTKHVSSNTDLHCSFHGTDSNHEFPVEENSAGGKFPLTALLEVRGESEDVGCGKALRCGAAVGPGCPATQEEKGGQTGKCKEYFSEFEGRGRGKEKGQDKDNNGKGKGKGKDQVGKVNEDGKTPETEGQTQPKAEARSKA